MNKLAGLILILILATSSLMLVHFSYASTPSVPEFTVQIAAHPYDVPPTTTTIIDPYTGKETVTTHAGYHVENKSIEVRIKNNLGASYYNFRYKDTMKRNGVTIHPTLTMLTAIIFIIL